MEGLEGLGVNVQSQETLENDIIQKLEEKAKLKEQESVLKQVKKELKHICQKIREQLRRKKSYEKQIKLLYKSASTLTSQQSRQISSLLNDQESLEKSLIELFSSQSSNLQRLKDCDYDFEHDTEIKVLIVKEKEETVENNEEDEGPSEETELQKNIRLGDVTAFGNTLQTKSSTTRDEVNFHNYIQQQLGAEGESSTSQSSNSRKRRYSSASESDSGFVDVAVSQETSTVRPKKCKLSKKSKTDSGVKSNDVDSDWKPDESSEEEFEPLIKKKEAKKSSKPQRSLYDEEEVGWRTDDSDFDGTDDEEEVVRRRRKHGDDGDRELYLARVATWQANRSQEARDLDGQYEELEGGLRVPQVIYCLIVIAIYFFFSIQVIWSRLFSYQKVGVQWMWELHQQRCGGILGDEMGLGKTIQVRKP